MWIRSLCTAFTIHLAVTNASATDILVPADEPTIQDAIDAAVTSADIIYVAPGVYIEFIDFLGKDIIIRSIGGPMVTTITAPAPGTSVVTCVGGETSAAVLDGFTISGGDSPEGGGMRIVSSSPTVHSCVFVGNTAAIGGGLIARASSSRIEGCRFIGNSTAGMGARGGGLSVECATSVGPGGCGGLPSDVTLINCIFSTNTSVFGAGANVHTTSAATFVGCTFRDNATPGAGAATGGGMRVRAATVELINCRFDGNTAASDGAALQVIAGSSVDVTSCTIADNSTLDPGGGGILNLSSTITITNSIVWGNAPAQLLSNVPMVTVAFSDVEGGAAGVGNIDADPLFVDAAADDYRLGAGSPCIDAGDNAAVPSDTLDLDDDADTGEPLPYDRQTLPRFFDDPDTTDSGAGTAPIVDMGAFESQGSQFEAPQEFSTAGGAVAIAADDLDGDGDVDLIVAIPDSEPQTVGTVQILLNDGDDRNGKWMGLTPGATLTVGVDPIDIATGLFDGDGLPDIAVANSGSNSVSVFKNLGGAAFLAQPDVLVGGSPTSLAAGDFVGDPSLDLAVAVLPAIDPDGIEFYAGNGGIPFGGGDIQFTFNTVVASDGEPLGLDPGDIDEDRDVDLVWANKASDAVHGILVPISTSDTFSTDPGLVVTPVALALADFDLDKIDLDIAVANAGDDSVSVLRTQIDAKATVTLSLLENIPLDGTPVAIEAVDLDRDGDADIVVVVDNETRVENGIQVIYNNSGGSALLGSSFGAPVTYVVDDNPFFTTDPNDIVAADMNDDGSDDLATSNEDDNASGGSVSVLLTLDDTAVCPGDFDGNANVGFSDLSALLAAWGPCAPDCPTDLDDSGDVGFGDLTTLLSNWGDCGDEPT